MPFSTKNILVWMPVIDGNILPGQPNDLIQSGEFAKVPVIVGFVRNETARFVPDVPFGNTIYETVVKVLFSSNSSEVLQQYPPMRRQSRIQLDLLSTDYAFLCSGRYIARRMAEEVPLYMYDFAHAPGTLYPQALRLLMPPIDTVLNRH